MELIAQYYGGMQDKTLLALQNMNSQSTLLVKTKISWPLEVFSLALGSLDPLIFKKNYNSYLTIPATINTSISITPVLNYSFNHVL